MFATKLYEKLIALGLADPQEIIGCSESEIEQIKAAQTVTFLPEIYVEFLRKMGKLAGNLYLGSDWAYPDLLKLKLHASELLNENANSFVLPDDAFVFLMHQGYQFMYFRTNDLKADPEVYYYIEMEDIALGIYAPVREWEHLSEFLTLFIRERENEQAQLEFLAGLKI